MDNNLPPGWDIDYDGVRWFYKYRSSGLIQYTFPKEGDEFPDFVDASAPAPTLAPEERLESQQQVRRRGDGGPGNGPRSKPSMSATGGPVSATWDDDDGDYTYFQPENFMYLGPGGYSDVSPLVNGEGAGARTNDVSPSPSKATMDTASEVMSPLVSSITTPQPARAEPVPEQAVHTVPTPMATSSAEAQAGRSTPCEVPMLDGRERHELPEATRFNPVGVVPEMPSEATARARIELHPDPVEILDNTVLAPIETFYLNSGTAELSNSPVERKEPAPQPRRRSTSQPIQRVYPFQPTEDDDPDRPPTPLGPAPAPTPSPQPPTDTIPQDKNRSYTPFTPSTSTTPVATPLPQSRSETPTLATPEPKPEARSRSPSPQGPFKISRKPTKSASPVPSPSATNAGGAPQASQSQVTQRSLTQSPIPTAEPADAPPPVPEKDYAPSPAGSTGYPDQRQQRPHSNSLPGSLRPLGLAEQLRGVPLSLQPGTPPPPPMVVPGRAKAKPKPRATPSPLGFAKRSATLPTPDPRQNPQSASPEASSAPGAKVSHPSQSQQSSSGQMDPRPAVVSPPEPLSGRSAPEQPLSTPSPLEIRSTSPGPLLDSSSQLQARSVVSSAGVHPSASGPSSDGSQQPAPAQGQPPQRRATGSYFPPQPEGNRSPPQSRSEDTPPSAPRGPPRPPKQPLQHQPPAAPQQTPQYDPTVGHFLDPITEQPDLEDAASLARKASLASQASRASSHRHSMPVMPTVREAPQNHVAAPARSPGAAPPNPQLGRQPQMGAVAYENPQLPPRPQDWSATTANPTPQLPPRLQHDNFQPNPTQSLYTNLGMPLPAGRSAAHAQEKGKSKWLSKLLKSRQPQKPSAQQHQQMWQGPGGLVLPPSQSPAPGAPWSPGSVGTTLAFPPPGGAQMQQVSWPGFQGVEAGPAHQRNGSGGVQMVTMQRQPAHAHTKSVPPPATQPVPRHPLQLNPVIQSAPASPPQPQATSRPRQNSVPARPPPGTEQAQSPTDTVVARTESVRSAFSMAGAGPARTESVRSDFTTISTSEAQVQPVLRPQLIQVSRAPGTHQQANGLAPAPQMQYAAAPDRPNGQPVQKHDSLRVAPLHLQKRVSAEGMDGASGRDSLVSEVSSVDSADSRRASALSGSVTQGKRMSRVVDYSGGGWGYDA